MNDLTRKMASLLLLTLPFSLLLAGCGGVSVNNAEVNDLSWLEGQWQGNTKEKGVTSRYKMLSSKSISGSTYITDNQDTVGIHAIDIAPTQGKILLNLRTKQNRSKVGYELTEIGSKKVVFQNEEAQYPRTIAYSLKGDTLKTKWTGQDKRQTFNLLKSTK